MGNFFTLVSIENTKLWKRLSAKVMLIIMVVISVAVIGFSKYYSVSHKDSNAPKTEVSESWKQDLEKEITVKKASLKEAENSNNKMMKSGIDSMKKSIAENEYRIKNNIKPESKQSIWTQLSKFDYGSIIALFVIIACAGAVAGEFTDGTMKMMISRPYSRSEILTAKLISSILYGLTLLLTTFILNFLLIGILFGFDGIGAKEMLWTGKNILYISAALKTLIVLGLQFLQILVYVILAFSLSAIFRSRSIATGFSLFLLLVGANIAAMVAMYFNWGKYLPFGTSNFATYINQGAYIAGISLGFALIIAAIYSIIFCFIGYYIFQKRDI